MLNGKQNPAYRKAWYEKNREAQVAYHKQYRITHNRPRGTDVREYRVMVWNLLRQRDGGNCGICGNIILPGEESVDHIIPKISGGSQDAENLRLTHRFCNMSKRDGRQGKISGDEHWTRRKGK